MKKNLSNEYAMSPQPSKSNKVVRGTPSAVPYAEHGVHTKAAVKHKSKKKRKAILIVVSCFLVLMALMLLAMQYMFGDLAIQTLNPDELGINKKLSELYDDVKNIALFGVDTRDPENMEGRSDSIMVVSVDRKNNTIKLTSLLRDSLVPIEGYGKDKLNHAFSYGQAPLAIKTINQAFELDIEDYVAINFQGFSKVIEEIGGIEMEITEAERKQINIYANRDGLQAPKLESAGVVTLNGAQATAYARIRKIDGDDGRANRQQKVLEKLLQELKTIPKSQYPALIKTVMSLTETSLSVDQILAFAPMLLNDPSLERNMIPTEKDNPDNARHNGMWVWKYDLEAAAKRLHSFIYESDSNDAEQSKPSN